MAATRAAVKRQAPATKRENAMEVFLWSGTDKRGKKMHGEVQAKSASLVKAELRKQGIQPISVKTRPKPLFGKAGKRITAQDLTVFSRQIATMLQAGVPMVQAFDILAGGQTNPRMKEMLVDLRDQIAGGSSLTEALGSYPVQFDELYRNLVHAGEGAGVLDTVLDTVATYKERTEALKGKIKKALFYPAAVVAVAIIVSAILLIFVIPQFEEVFKNFGADLPAFTVLVVNMSRFMVSWWWLALLIVIGSGVAFISAYKRSEALQHGVDRLLLRLPVIGQILHQSAIARFARTLALTFKAGVPLVEALETVAGATGSQTYGKAVREVGEDVAVGYQLNMAMKQVNIFPHMVVQMVAIGEEAGALDTMLFKVAEFYEQEVNNAVDALSSLLEPFIIVLIGSLVGGMVVAMYLPIFKIAAAV
ncbi:MAG: type II secretion system F family protein [Xanthomonadaceae bacterium]|nr:type II secretion system F family protein [Xanthomonadaceae bacterium]